jgi:general stress protein YciG
MSGTKAGGKKAAATNKAKYGNQFYANIGREGGKKGRTGGFYANPERAKIAGRKGGLTSSKAPTLSLEERRQQIAELLKNEKEMEEYEVS